MKFLVVMVDITIDKMNEVDMCIHAERGILQEIYEFFAFYAKDYKFMPKFKMGLWDGRIRLFNWQTQTMKSGLIHELIRWALENEYKLDIDPEFGLKTKDDPCPVDVQALFESFNLPFTPHDYQVKAVETMLKHKRRLVLSPTSSGKSLIIYGTLRGLLNMGKKVLIVVPTTSLVEQMVGDFDEYSEHNEFDAYDTCHMIYSGKDKVTQKPVTVTTWQSVFRLGAKFFEKFDAVFCDEAHLASAGSITSIMEKCVNAEYRNGLTGTIEDTQSHKFTLMGLFGRVYETISTKEMMDRGIVADLTIKPIIFEHTDEEKKVMSKLSYDDEIQHIINDDWKNGFACKLAMRCKGNTLMLFRYKTHGKALYARLKELNTQGKTIYYVDGDTPTKEREALRAYTEKHDDVIILASYGTFSTGISIKNLQNLIFAHPMKSKIKVLQSVGRALRKTKDGDKATLYDLVCDYRWKTKTNTTMSHFKERLKQYNKAQFEVVMKVLKV